MTDEEFAAAQEAMVEPLEKLLAAGIGYFIWVVAPIGDELATSSRSNMTQVLWDEVKPILIKEIQERRQEPLPADDLRSRLEAIIKGNPP